jgi:prepilin-type N-terminal cleavage/methylation domain-containing protein
VVVSGPQSGLRAPQPNPRRCRGFTLFELLAAVAIGAVLLAGLGSVARESVQAGSHTRDTAEAVYQGKFALQRVAAAARATAPRSLLAPAANTSGNWFDPLHFCVNGAGALVETTTADTGCAGTKIIAARVATFTAAVPAGSGALDSSSASITITLTVPGGGTTVTLSERVRLGGGVQ